jgi:hypothetical protein
MLFSSTSLLTIGGRTSLIRVNNNTNNIRFMSSTAKVWVDKNTRVLFQGFTGKFYVYITLVQC